MDRLDGANRPTYQRINEADARRSSPRRSREAISRRAGSLRGILRPPRIHRDQRRSSTGGIPKDRKVEGDLEQGYPNILETDVILPVRGGSMEDASSVSCEGSISIRLPSFSSDGTETDGSFRTAQLIPTVTSKSIGSGDYGRDSEGDFLSCREDSDREFLSCRECSDHLSVFSDAKSFTSRPFLHRDSDGDSFYTCRRLNNQGLRSALAVPTNVNTDQAFNIPLHVFAQSIQDEEKRKQKARYRNQYIWRPVKIMTVIAFVIGAVATTVLLVQKRSRNSDQSEDNLSQSLAGASTTIATAMPLTMSQIPSFAPSFKSSIGMDQLVPSVAPWVDENKQTLGPTLFVFITGNFQEIKDVP